MDMSSIFSSQNSIDNWVNTYMRFEERPKNLLLDKKDVLSERITILSDLDKKLTALKTKSDRLSDSVMNYFAAKKASSSSPDDFDVSAGSSAVLGNHSLTVQRLAVSDTRVSQQFSNINTSFTSFTTDQTFTLEVAHPTDTDASNRVSISVTVAAATFAKTDDEVLTDITDAINTAMASAVTNETINSDEVVHANVVSEETGKSRIVLGSENTGYTYRMDFGASTLLDTLQVNAASQSSGTSGGYMTSVGSGATDSQLNSQFLLDGLTFYRDGNNISDALPGVTLKLRNTFTTTETLNVSSDIDTVTTEVNGFIGAVNDAIKYLKENAQMNPDTHQRGALASDSTYRDLVYSLRNIVTDEVTSVTSSEYGHLFNIGISFNDSGELAITDADKFTAALEANPSFVSDLFNTSDGVAANLNTFLEDIVKTGGTIDASKKNVDSELNNLSDRVKLMDDLLSRKEAQLREQFTRLQESMIMFQNQQSYVGLFSNFNS